MSTFRPAGGESTHFLRLSLEDWAPQGSKLLHTTSSDTYYINITHTHVHVNSALKEQSYYPSLLLLFRNRTANGVTHIKQNTTTTTHVQCPGATVATGPVQWVDVQGTPIFTRFPS